MASIDDLEWETRKEIKILSFNFFQRPPLIRTSYSDYKDLRLKLFCKYEIMKYDIVSMQEMFEYGSSRKKRLVEYAADVGFPYHYSTPNGSLLRGKVDGGLLILSRFPIVECEIENYKDSVHADMFCQKAAIYTRIRLCRNVYVNIISTHLQSKYSLSEDDHNKRSSMVQIKQLHAIGSMIQRINLKNESFSKEPVLILGDLNIDARQGKSGKMKYIQALGILNSYLGKGLSGLKDLMLEKYNFHPVTYGDGPSEDTKQEELDVLRKTLDGRNIVYDATLTDKGYRGARQCIDYIFFANMSDSSSPLQINHGKSHVNPLYTLDRSTVTHLSDHYGLVCVLELFHL